LPSLSLTLPPPPRSPLFPYTTLFRSLVAPTDLAMPRRVGTGVDPKRLAMIVAVLSRHAGVALGQADVFVNVAGGVRIDEPGADRSEEHTSELQSRFDLVCRLLLEKKK